MLVSDDILAVVLEQFCGKLGLRVPKDLSIVSFNNSLFSRITSPQLTTVDVNPYQLGMEAASQTINHIENQDHRAAPAHPTGELLPAAGGLMCKKRGRPLSFPERQNGLVLLIFSGTPAVSCRSVP